MNEWWEEGGDSLEWGVFFLAQLVVYPRLTSHERGGVKEGDWWMGGDKPDSWLAGGRLDVGKRRGAGKDRTGQDKQLRTHTLSLTHTRPRRLKTDRLSITIAG
jgi:hypothetical protein